MLQQIEVAIANGKTTPQACRERTACLWGAYIHNNILATREHFSTIAPGVDSHPVSEK